MNTERNQQPYKEALEKQALSKFLECIMLYLSAVPMLLSGLVQGGHYRMNETKNQEKCQGQRKGMIMINHTDTGNRRFSSSATRRSRCTFSSAARTLNILFAFSPVSSLSILM